MSDREREPLGAIEEHLARVVDGGIQEVEKLDAVAGMQDDLEHVRDVGDIDESGIEIALAEDPHAGDENGADKGDVRLTGMDRSKESHARSRIRAHKTAFLRALKQSGTVRIACEVAGISKQTAFNWKNRNPWFKAKWAEALDDFVDLVEARAGQLGVEGVLEPVWYEGVKVGEVRKFDSKMLQFLLQTRRREVYGQKVAIDQRTASVSVKVDETEAARLVAEALPMLRDVLGPGV